MFIPRSTLTTRTALLVCFEAALIALAVAAGAWFRLGGDDAYILFRVELGLQKTLLVTAVCQLCLYYSDLYDFRTVSDRRELFVRLIQALGATSVILAVIYFWFPQLILGRGVFIMSAAVVLLVITGWRVAFEWITRTLGPRERLLLIGTGPGAIELARELHDLRHTLGVQIVGFVDPDPAQVGQPVINPGVIGTISDVPDIVRSRKVDRVVVSLADARGKLPVDQLLEMKLNDGVSFDHLASVYEEYTGKIVLIVAGLVKLTSTGSVLYHQERVGQHGRIFTVHKFRSMVTDAEANTGAVWSQPNDHRITPVGRMLRRTRLDELPQLWNVLRGDMSLVGPRPERPEFVRSLTDQIPFYGQRHVVRPGLTGWAQVRYTYGATVEDAMEKLQYDLYYIKNMSLALDLFVLFSTVKTVLHREGA
jgi:lipopolysaccharide/colanic/teichoic acid biosynthesis glycosyltransferase